MPPSPPLSNALSPDSPAPWTWLVPSLHMLLLGMIVFALTPYTYYIDDIKMALFLAGGSALALAAVAAMGLGWVPVPSKFVGIGLAAYGVVLVLSTLASAFRWAGINHLIFFCASVGFFLGGMACGSSRATSRVFIAFAVAMLAGTNLLGFLQYDLFGTRRTGMTILYAMLYGGDLDQAATPSPLQALIGTFDTMTRDSLMSTILNRDFYAAFCLLYFPFAAALAIIARRTLWRALGITTAFLSLASIFLCKSKGEYIFAVAAIPFFAVLFSVFVRRTAVRRTYLAAWAGGILIVLLTLALLNAPGMLERLKSVSYSVSSRQIIFLGAWKMFLQFPIFGGGPGTFRIYFPRFRRDDYFEHEITNVTDFAHNYFLDILSETGIFGALTFALFGGALALLACRVVFRSKDDPVLQVMMIAALTGLLGMFGSNMTSPNARWPIGAVGLWSILGFTAGLVRQSDGWTPAQGSIFSSSGAAAIRGSAASLRSWTKPAYLSVLAVASFGLILGIREGRNYWTAAVSYQLGVQRFESIADPAMAHMRRERKLKPEQVRLMIKSLERSGDYFRRALEVYPEHLSSYYKLGSVENLLSLLTPEATATPSPADRETSAEHLLRAREAYEGLATYSPDYSEIHYNIGVVYYRLAVMARELGHGFGPDRATDPQTLATEIALDEELSRQGYARMQQLSRKADVLRNLGDSHMDAHDYALAQAVFRRGVELYPDRRDLALRFYQASDKLKDAPGKVEALKAMWLLEPGQRGLLYGHGKIGEANAEGALDLALSAKLDDAFEEIRQLALERNPVDPEIYRLELLFRARRNETDKLLASAQAYLKLDGADPEALGRAADAALQAKNVDLARSLYAAAAKAPANGEWQDKARKWLAENPA